MGARVWGWGPSGRCIDSAGTSAVPSQASAFGGRAGPPPHLLRARPLTHRGTQGCPKALSWCGRTRVTVRLLRKIPVLG